MKRISHGLLGTLHLLITNLPLLPSTRSSPRINQSTTASTSTIQVLASKLQASISRCSRNSPNGTRLVFSGNKVRQSSTPISLRSRLTASNHQLLVNSNNLDSSRRLLLRHRCNLVSKIQFQTSAPPSNKLNFNLLRHSRLRPQRLVVNNKTSRHQVSASPVLFNNQRLSLDRLLLCNPSQLYLAHQAFNWLRTNQLSNHPTPPLQTLSTKLQHFSLLQAPNKILQVAKLKISSNH